MTIRYHESPDQFRGKGVVILSWNEDRYGGYWDLAPDGPPTALEECPSSSSASDVVRWGQARTPNVLIRPKSDPGRHYWAGASDPSAHYAELPVWVEE